MLTLSHEGPCVLYMLSSNPLTSKTTYTANHAGKASIVTMLYHCPA